MKRFHVHVAVSDLAHSTRFYSAMFGMAPTVQKPDYAKWMLDDPRVNFAISARDGGAGVNHLGFQADSDDELQEIHARLQTADTAIEAEQGANCCYAKSDKYWVQDPSGIAWESFRSLDTIPFYGEQSHEGATGGAAGGAVSAEASSDADGGSGCSTACCPPTLTPATTEAKSKACCNG